MHDKLFDETLALAGVAQAVYLVQQIARRGQADEAALAASLNSVFAIDADTAPAVFGGAKGVELGLRQVLRQLGGGSGLDPEQASYASTLLVLERKFMADTERVETMQRGLRRLQPDSLDGLAVLDDALVGGLSALYRENISSLTPRVMVNGEPVHLRSARNTDRVRALLLAGLRSAVLWRQCGGSRWRLFMQRRRLLDCAQRWLSGVDTHA